ncbi:potassium channel family protein [Odoribacter laneus]|uniref:potassium channel family protein n=1 Tax=Odoribacter laneus TaxID=626933 RepID=UPI000334E4AD|nr:TrkA family potassium uptake protein [Odoribacter laneus]CCZ81503.1 putative uncharacterized protein [Odoribacter laneus CAG:561]
MNCIIMGLSHFGVALAQRLTAMGHEVLGIDMDLHKINEYKDSIKNTICLNINNQQAIQTLPLKDADIIFVTIRKDIGASIQAVALLKQYKARRIIACSISDIHTTILKAMGITEIIRPELEYADLFTTRIEWANSIFTYKITSNYFIQELKLPDSFIGRRLSDVQFEKEFNLQLIAIKHPVTEEKTSRVKISLLDQPEDNFIIGENDVFILAGNPKAFRKLTS